LKKDGIKTSVDANKGHHGAVWKMVVQFEKEGFQGWVNYPGGQTGNPFRPEYTEFLDMWLEEQLRPVKYVKSLKDPRLKKWTQWSFKPDSK